MRGSSHLLLCLFACTALALAALKAAGQPGREDPPDPQALFANIPWFAAERGAFGLAFELECRVTRSSGLPAEVVHANWARLERLPDHPDRGRFEMLRRMLQEPEMLTLRIAYTPGGGWSRSDAQEFGGRMIRTDSGGRNDLSWMGTRVGDDSALRVVKRDVPFPVRFNARAVHMRFIDEIGLLLSHGLRNVLTPTATISEWRAAGGSYSGRITTEYDSVWAVSGDLGADGLPVSVHRVELVAAPREGVAVSRASADFRPLGPGGALIPFEMTRVDAVGIRERYEVVGMRVLDPGEARRVGVLPDFSGYDAVHDFREPGTGAASAAALESDMIVWSSADGSDHTVVAEARRESTVRRGAPGIRVLGGIVVVFAAMWLVVTVAKVRTSHS